MKFSEKLIELRKKSGLSQEELGYKLNVTRQTVSKWELGQTTPEMSKLVEIGKLFNVSVDELLNENETEDIAKKIENQENEYYGEEKKKNKSIIVILIIIGVFLIITIPIILVAKNFIGIFNKAGKAVEQNQETFKNIVNNAREITEEKNKEFNNKFDEMSNEINEIFNETNFSNTEINQFNSKYELYTGVKSGFFVNSIINHVISDNSKGEKEVVVSYNGNIYKQANELASLQSQFDASTEYLITFEYDDNGFINLVKIENA